MDKEFSIGCITRQMILDDLKDWWENESGGEPFPKNIEKLVADITDKEMAECAVRIVELLMDNDWSYFDGFYDEGKPAKILGKLEDIVNKKFDIFSLKRAKLSLEEQLAKINKELGNK